MVVSFVWLPKKFAVHDVDVQLLKTATFPGYVCSTQKKYLYALSPLSFFKFKVGEDIVLEIFWYCTFC